MTRPDQTRPDQDQPGTVTDLPRRGVHVKQPEAVQLSARLLNTLWSRGLLRRPQPGPPGCVEAVAVSGRVPLSKAADGRPVLVVYVSPWLRPGAATSPDRSFLPHLRAGKNEHRMIPGWRYAFVAALQTGSTPWTAIPDAVRHGPSAAVAAVTIARVREVVERLIAAAQWPPGDHHILIVLAAGYDVPHIAHFLAYLPVEMLGRTRSDWVMRRPTPPRVSYPRADARPSTAASSSSATPRPGAPSKR